MAKDLTHNNYNGDIDVEPENITYDYPAHIEMYFNKLIYNLCVEREHDDQDWDDGLVANESVNKSTYEHYQLEQQDYPGSVVEPVSKVYWNYAYKSKTLVVFTMTYNRDGHTTVAVTKYEDDGAGNTIVTSEDHGMISEDKISLTGSTNYNGVHVVTVIDEDRFSIPVSFVADDAAGYCKLFIRFEVQNKRKVDRPYDVYSGNEF